MRLVLGIVAVLMVAVPPAFAAEDVVIGAIYPLTGNAAQIGADARAAIDTTLDIVNGAHEPLPMLMGGGGGLDRLGGAKLRVVYADHQNDPQKARAEAERLITQDHVVGGGGGAPPPPPPRRPPSARWPSATRCRTFRWTTRRPA